ncbi:hypothetical protein ACHMW6_30180 [Pseudoduganella sp. UC29_106]|uniref:hypothetical protein n=1 Tax=Pseudoduganella sp. UC29_106 TaxID=3374553 RepID=UPI0037575094
MMQNPNEELRTEIAAAAARLVAQDGADYGTAKRKAARQILGEAQAADLQNLLPDNAQIEDEVRLYHALFNADTQPARLFRLRTLALQVMEMLERYNPFLTGAVLNGTAGEHNDIHLQLFADSAKEVQIFLLNRNLQIEISESPHFRGPRFDPVETVSFMWQREGVHVELYETDDIRGAKRKSGDKLLRADIAEVRTLLTNSSHQ